MRNANQPSGPGRPTHVKRDAVAEREELDEVADDGAAAQDPTRAARQAERDAHTSSGGRDAPSDSGRRNDLSGSARNRGHR
jgi:hypothetical protein